MTWRPLTERDMEGYDPEATLNTRAANITDRICQDFCQWLESLAAGTNQASGIDVDVLKDMFETDFSAEVCRTMQVIYHPKLPTDITVPIEGLLSIKPKTTLLFYNSNSRYNFCLKKFPIDFRYP